MKISFLRFFVSNFLPITKGRNTKNAMKNLKKVRLNGGKDDIAIFTNTLTIPPKTAPARTANNALLCTQTL